MAGALPPVFVLSVGLTLAAMNDLGWLWTLLLGVACASAITRALRRCHARVLYRALCRLRFDSRAWTRHRLLDRLVTTPQTVQSFMPAEIVTKLFEPFHRGPNAVGPGTGLGLATAAAAIRAHHGSIGFEPRTDGGTRFWVRLPV